eukprot:UC1_evm1s728
MPHPDTFPIDGLSFRIKGVDEPIELSPMEVSAALQYSPTPGLAQLNALLRDMLVREHAPPLASPPPPPSEEQEHQRQENEQEQGNGKVVEPVGYGVCVTNGSQEAVSRTFDMLLNPGDALLVESPTYSGSLAHLAPLDVCVVGLKTDGEGLVPSSLSHTLDSWDPSTHGGASKPRVLYTIPTGGNPSGACMPTARRKEIYGIARSHDLIIMEDDPYYYLQFRDTPLPSLTSMDVDGRVVRFDSFSKVLSAGLRIGFASGPAPLMRRLGLH